MKESQVFKNAKWIIICKIAQSVIQLIIGMLSARYLGPSNYGLINYAASIVAFALPIMKLGFDATLVYELVDNPKKEGEIMGTALLLNIVSSIVCIFGVTGFVAVANPGDTEALIICVLYSLSIFFAAVEMIQYWFQYKLLSKYSSVVMLLSYIVVSVYKIFLLATAKSVYWFAVSHSIEYAIIGLCLIIIYFLNGGQKLSFSFTRAQRMFSKSKYYIFAALMVVVFQNTASVMLTSMVSKAENGLFAAAMTSVTVFQFVYIAIIDSFRPYILSEKTKDTASYERNISRVYSIITYLSIAQGVVFWVFAKLIIIVLYGQEYLPAVPLLRILAIYFIFSTMGTVRNVWILAEEKQKYLSIINLTGAVINVVLNAIMIPLWESSGAAIASLITQFVMNFILGFIIKALRPNNRLLIQSLDPKFFWREAKTIVKMCLKKE